VFKYLYYTAIYDVTIASTISNYGLANFFLVNWINRNGITTTLPKIWRSCQVCLCRGRGLKSLVKSPINQHDAQVEFQSSRAPIDDPDVPKSRKRKGATQDDMNAKKRMALKVCHAQLHKEYIRN